MMLLTFFVLLSVPENFVAPVKGVFVTDVLEIKALALLLQCRDEELLYSPSLSSVVFLLLPKANLKYIFIL